MSKELVISTNRHETKVAILEDDQLVEVYFQRANEYSLAGSIHKGRVTRVLPGMQSAFVDLGLERDTFLYVSDFFDEAEDFDRLPEPRRDDQRRDDQRRERDRERDREREARPSPAEQEGGPRTEAESSSAPSEGRQPAPATGGRSDEGDRDRRGRRSRRRRNRGRGFPESKYASSESRYEPEGSRGSRSAEAQPAAESGSQVETSADAAAAMDVLPGESLAKYRRANIAPLDEAEEDEIRSLQTPLPEPGPETTAEVVEELAIAEAVVESESSLEEVTAEAQIQEELSVEPDVTPSEPVIEEGAATRSETDETAVESPVEAVEAETSTAEETEPAPPSAPPQLTAQVREQGGRYGHRMTRRMRRKVRGGPGGESRFEQERRGDAATTSSAETQVARPEPTRGSGRPERAAAPSITDLLKEGQEIIVQIAKEPLGQKGARITSHIALPGRYVVYMPTVDHTGVSRKIASDEERQRLKRILQVHHAGVAGGFIVRTAGEGKSEPDIAADMNFLANLWLDIRQKAERQPAPVLLHHDLDIVERTLRDQFTDQFKDVWVDNEEMFERVLGFVQRFHPSLVPRVKLYTRPEPIFDAFNVTAELEKALRPKVWLKSGGYIVINQTEALVAIDVNTGKYVGRSNRLEDTIVKTNTEAVKEIVRQVRLRDLGGIIVVDFIDMDERKNRQKVMQALEDAMRADRAPYKILQFNDFGLVAITRKRVKQSLERALCMPCPHCEGAGYVKSVATIVSEILQEAHKIASAVEGKEVMLRVHPDVGRFLKSSQNKYLEELEEILHRPVLVRSDTLLHHEKFDLT